MLNAREFVTFFKNILNKNRDAFKMGKIELDYLFLLIIIGIDNFS